MKKMDEMEKLEELQGILDAWKDKSVIKSKSGDNTTDESDEERDDSPNPNRP